MVGYHRVTELLCKIDSTKASGFRLLPTKLLKAALLGIPEVFTDYLNICFAKSVFPEDWKTATVVFIPKKGDARNPDNLHPIALLPVTGKIMETILNDEIMFHLEQNGLLAEEQMGFRKN